MELIIGLICTIASLIGAGISINQANRAKIEKNEAAQIKEYLKEKYDNYEDSQLRQVITSTIEKLNRNRFQNRINNSIGKAQTDDMQFTINLLHEIMGQKLYEDSEVKQSVDHSIELLENINLDNYKSSIGTINGNLATISRKIDKKVRY